MAGDNSKIDPTGDVAQAMNQALQAERDADQAIAECQQQGHQTVHEARQRVRHITDRTNTRITLLDMRCKHQFNHKLSELELAFRKQQRALSDQRLDEQQLTEVIERLAEFLTGAGEAATTEGKQTE